MTTPDEFQHYYQVPAIHDEETRSILPDLSETGHVDHVAEYDRDSDTFIISTQKPARGLAHRRVERPEHGVHVATRAMLPTLFDTATQEVYDRVHQVQREALEAGKDPTKAGSAADKKLLNEAYARGERPQ